MTAAFRMQNPQPMTQDSLASASSPAKAFPDGWPQRPDDSSVV